MLGNFRNFAIRSERRNFQKIAIFNHKLNNKKIASSRWIRYKFKLKFI